MSSTARSPAICTVPGPGEALAHRSGPAAADAHLADRLTQAGFRTDSPSGYPLSGLAITVVRTHR